MRKINFTKMAASGNDFVVIDSRFGIDDSRKLTRLARQICDRKYGVGADGLLVLEKSKKADIKMRIFNADGSEAEMCGNGARCVALLCKSSVSIETQAGIIESQIKGKNVKIKLTDPTRIKLGLPIKIGKRILHVNFINTGVPHTVIFVEGLNKIDIVNLGRGIRNHKKFKSAGTNVDFVEVLSNNSIRIRTYERGVEGETLACGTGAVASALITQYATCLPAGKVRNTKYEKINVHTQSGGVLKVYFKFKSGSYSDLWLEGKAEKVYQGVYYV